MPLTSAGYEAPRAADFLTEIRTAFVARLVALGLPSSVDWERDTFLGQITATMAEALGDLGEGTQALYDAFDPNNAEGVQLDSLCLIVGVTRNPATASTVTLTLTGTPGTLIPSGSRVQGGGDDGEALWTTDANATIGGGGTTTVTATCTEVGAVVGLNGQIDEIVDAVAGWTAVENFADAAVGDDVESDADLRKRRQQSLQSGGRSVNSLRGSLLALDFLSAAVVIENDTAAVVNTGGVTLQPHSIAVIVYPSSITADEKQEVAELIYDQLPPGIYTNGTGTVATITGGDGYAKTIRFDYASTLTVNVACTVSLDVGYEVADVDTTIQALVVDYFAALGVGDDVRLLSLYALIATVEGVNGVTITLNGVAADAATSLTQFAVLGTNTVA